MSVPRLPVVRKFGDFRYRTALAGKEKGRACFDSVHARPISHPDWFVTFVLSIDETRVPFSSSPVILTGDHRAIVVVTTAIRILRGLRESVRGRWTIWVGTMSDFEDAGHTFLEKTRGRKRDRLSSDLALQITPPGEIPVRLVPKRLR